MKNKKIAKLYIAVLMCTLLFGETYVSNTVSAKSKTITIEKGKTYQLKIKKGSKVQCSNKKIAKVTKKGKIKALKEGKCTIKVKKGKRTMKYSVRVSNVKKKTEELVLTPSPTPISNPTERPVDGGYVCVNNLTVSSIEEKDDNTLIVCLSVDGQTPFFDKDKVKTVKFEYPKDKLSGIKIGDKVLIGYNVFRVTHEIENGTETIKGNVSMLLFD